MVIFVENGKESFGLGNVLKSQKLNQHLHGIAVRHSRATVIETCGVAVLSTFERCRDGYSCQIAFLKKLIGFDCVAQGAPYKFT